MMGTIMTRRELREHIFRQLFTTEFYTDSETERQEQMKLYFSHGSGDELEYPPCDVSEEERQQIMDKTAAVWSELPKIDSLIEKTSVGWTISRMNRTDLAILRLGVYELLFDETIPRGVAINEAVLLARKFGGEDSYSFVNGILGRLDREQSGPEDD